MLRDDELPLLKQCARCGSEKPVTDFNKRRGAKDGLQSECKQCQSNRYFGDLITRLRTMSATGWHPIGNEAADEIDRLTRERDEARAELERERMRLAACGVVAMSNTPESAARNREMHADYRSASCDDVASAVDREMALRAERDALAKALAELHEAASADFPLAAEGHLAQIAWANRKAEAHLAARLVLAQIEQERSE